MKRPPRHLGPAGKRLFQAVTADYELRDYELESLRVACEALDRCEEARHVIAAEGAIYHDRFGAPRKHPAVSIEETARIQYLRAVREIGLDPEGDDEARPPSLTY